MREGEHDRPDQHDYFMGIAMAVRRRANCLGSRIGALIVVKGRIVSTGYNGTPENMPTVWTEVAIAVRIGINTNQEPAMISASACTPNKMP